MVNMKPRLSAAEAAAELGVSRATLYAYVSRGMIRSEAQSGSRAKLYDANDVRALRGRSNTGAESDRLDGPPTLDTATTAIHDGRLFYKGIDVATLAASARLESVATLLWGADGTDPFANEAAFAPIIDGDAGGGIVSRLLIGLARAAETDLAGHARSADGISRTGARILTQLVATAAGRAPAGRAAHDTIAQGWGAPEAADLIRRALVVMADHELAASTYAVRVAASTGASPWRAVTAGLACLDGPRHGGAGERAAALLASVTAPSDAERVIAERLRHGESVAGFGHPLYPAIDPRAAVLLAAARALPRAAGVIARADALTVAARHLIGRAPNLDFGLAVAAEAAGLPREAPITLFAIGRSIGWVAHVIEQSRSPGLIRPRARYVGPAPE